MNHIPFSLLATTLPGEEGQCPKNLAKLADLACASGDRSLAESLIDRLYAHYDRQHSLVASLAASARPLCSG
jgi:hypothetical protein